MFKMSVESNLGDVVVKTTERRGLSPEELAERAVEQIVSVSSSVDPVVRQQAEAFRNRIYHVVLGIIKQAIKSDRTTLINEFIQQGQSDTATQADKYYSSIDDKMRKEFPDFFGVTPEAPEVETEVVTEEKRQPSNVVAPATRNSGTNKNPRNIRLTQTQVNIARQLGITPEQYAKQMLKET